MLSPLLCTLVSLGAVASAKWTQFEDPLLLAAINPDAPLAGIFVDPVTNVSFSLYDNRLESNVDTAFDAYLAASDSEPAPMSRIVRRDWWDCQKPQSPPKNLLQRCTRPETPRHRRRYHLSGWSNYYMKNLPNGASGDVGNFAAHCAEKGGSAQYKDKDGDGGTVYVCISDRATGCTDAGWK